MNITDDKITKIIGKMLRETVEGTIQWDISWSRSSLGGNLDGNSKIVGNVYYATINGKYLRLYKYETKHYTDFDEYFFVLKHQLEFYENGGAENTLWEFPQSNSIIDLYNEVCFKTSGAEGFMKDYLEPV